MKIINIKNSKQLSIKEIIELLCPFYLCMGALQGITILDNVHYILGLLIQGLSILLLLKLKKASSRYLMNYLLIVCIIGIIAIIFGIKGVEGKLIINRIFPLLSIFGIIVTFDPILNINLRSVVKYTEYILVIINIVMFIDILLQKILKIGFWYPMNYLGNRYSGPFGEPNFAALYIVITFFMVFWSEKKKNRKLLLSLILGANLLFTGSLSAILFFIIVFIIRRVALFRNDHIMMIQVIILMLYMLLLGIWTKNDDLFMKYGIFLLEKLYGSVNSAQIKYIALTNRLEVQWNALRIGLRDLTGQGPRQIVGQLGRDTHNSYLGYFFEQGILGVALILNSLKFYKREITEVTRCCFYFVVLMALLLNVHYMTAYSILLVLLQIGKEDMRR